MFDFGKVANTLKAIEGFLDGQKKIRKIETIALMATRIACDAKFQERCGKNPVEEAYIIANEFYSYVERKIN